MKWLSNKSLSLFLAAVLLLTTISLIMTSPTIAQDEKSKEFTFTETDSYYIENDYIQIKFVQKRPYIEWSSPETSSTKTNATHKLYWSIKGLTEYFDKNPNEVYDQGDAIYRYIELDDPNQLIGNKYDVTKSVSKTKITLTFRARSHIFDTDGKDVGFADMRFVFKIFASESGAAVYAPQDGIEMAIEVIVSKWDYHNKDNNVLALNTSLIIQSEDSATIEGHKTIQTSTTYEKIPPIGPPHTISDYNSTNIQMGYIRLANTDSKDTEDYYSFKASATSQPIGPERKIGTQIVIMSTYVNTDSVHQMSLGVPESISTATGQGQGTWDFGGITSIFQGFPNILENILYLEIIVVVAVLAVIIVFLFRRAKV